ncbi:ionotropic receptor 75a-like isoform X1 [Cardiocondyla obscurior]|uniref:ionotropic receptor 75a-like isoform X1 n=1 Tax=Cardiocondyla obscurior TaxID=286306 RepID=UPI003965636B
MLDLDCDYATEILRQVPDAHSKGMFIAPMKWLLLQDRKTIGNTNATVTYNNSILNIFEDLSIYPDSDVILAQRFDGDFLNLTSVYRPSPQRKVIWENRGNWTTENGLRMSTFVMSSTRRRNLQQTALKSCLVVTNPDTLNHLTDFMYQTIDPIAKANYVWVHHLVNRMNATVTFDIENTFGRNKNGSWDGMIGKLQRREIDIGSGAYMLTERVSIVEYIQLYTNTNLCFIFRRPLLSTVKNIFAMPFQRNVWIATATFLVLVFCLLYLSMKWEYYRSTSNKSAVYKINSEPTIVDDLLVLLGAFAQQGYSYEPYRIPSRIVTLMLLVASLSLYAAYTANIVALVQSTTDSIKTLSDLLHSPLTLGAQNYVFNRYYLEAQQGPVRKAIVDKITSKSNWISLEEGIHRLKSEPFAFHGTRNVIYNLMQHTYREEEKCGITEISFVNSVDPLLVIPKRSPYLEIIKNGALKLREYGLMYRTYYRLYARKPACSGQTNFITIGFTECYFALLAMGYGTLISVFVFVLELLWYKKQSMKMKERPIPVAEESDLSIVKYID